MVINFSDLLYSLSYALDCVEKELLGVHTHHGQRVAAMCVKIGRDLGMDDKALVDLASSAILHDNALTEYIQSEYQKNINVFSKARNLDMGIHCKMGEDNIKLLPFNTPVAGNILYHHENANGTGPFGKKADETPLNAQIIHLADTIDATWNLHEITDEKYEKVSMFMKDNEGRLFSPTICSYFFNSLGASFFERLKNERAIDILHDLIPDERRDFSNEEIKGICKFFAKIIDYKSSVTCSHSMGIASKAEVMAKYYNFSDEDQTKFYMAGALHDVGKLVISRDILEKPGKLSGEEFVEMKNHAYFTYKILSQVEGLEDVTLWASLHHEKLNGKGYPFGKTAKDLNQKERLMACIDIYQALTEARSYKVGYSHEKSISIMRDMVAKGFIDSSIVEDINKVFAPAPLS